MVLVAAALALASGGGDGNEQAARRTEPVLVAHGGVTEAQRFAATRPGSVAFALVTEDGKVHGRNVDTPFRSASVTKAMLLVAVLRKAATRSLSAHERELLHPMITASDNDAADEVYESVGDLGLQAVAHAAGMRHLQPVGALYETRITAADQARFFFRIDRLVPQRHRAYARELLHGVIAPHWWGIASVARARHFTVFFKSGWREEIEHQVALLERFGRRVSLAVLTSGETAADGRATEAGIAARVLAA